MARARILLMAMAVLFALVASGHPQTPPAKSAPTPEPSKTDPQQGSVFNPQSLDVMTKKQYKSTDSPDKYDPTHPDLNRTFNMSNKGFSTAAVSGVDQNALQHLSSYHAKTFDVGSQNSVNLPKGLVANSQTSLYQDKTATLVNSSSSTFKTPTFHVSGSKSNSFNQSYSIPAKPVFAAQPAYASDKAYPDSNKPYTGPEAQTEKQGVSTVQALSSVSSVPNRALTVDEVKSLLNRGHMPDDEEQHSSPTLPSLPPSSSFPVTPSLPALPLEDPSVKPAEPMVLPQR